MGTPIEKSEKAQRKQKTAKREWDEGELFVRLWVQALCIYLAVFVTIGWLYYVLSIDWRQFGTFLWRAIVSLKCDKFLAFYVPTISDAPAPIDRQSLFPMAIVSLLVTSFAAAPYIDFMDRGWFVRRNEIADSMSTTALSSYFSNFCKHLDLEIEPKANLTSVEKFYLIYREHYGLHPFGISWSLLIAVIADAGVVAGYMVMDKKIVVPSDIGLCALSGAYLFAVGDGVFRMHKRTLNVADTYWYALRIIVALPVGLVLGDRKAAFAVGLLPVEVFLNLFIYLANRLIGRKAEKEKPDAIKNLSGVTTPLAITLESEGVNSIEQLAVMDPIIVAIRTGLPFRLVIRLCSKALVWQYIRDSTSKLESIGLVDAKSVAKLPRDYETDTPGAVAGEKAAQSKPKMEADAVLATAALRLFPDIKDKDGALKNTLHVFRLVRDEYDVFLAHVDSYADEAPVEGKAADSTGAVQSG
ncbi:hypothetical protein [Caballeronia novacaledonica]|uniref:Transmembrane protein n=1 Tax=Caballeronia novacaledonica TaxID=1544861 RepID=A0AA37IHF2_9BURK|nr:hypothetical protein [Caballeronia novacaledonica]GJH29314.1 hypothetical protein CBA19CS42_32380 [Caballeronia novacaledonica]